MIPNELEGKEVEEFRQRVLSRLKEKTTIPPHEIHRRDKTKDKAHYIKTETVVNLAHEIFEGMWSTEVVEGPERFDGQEGKYVCKIKLEVFGFKPIFDFGINVATQNEASSSFKSAITDGQKRVFRKLGDRFGLFIADPSFNKAAYEQQYLEEHPDYKPPKFGTNFSQGPSGRRENDETYIPAKNESRRQSRAGASKTNDHARDNAQSSTASRLMTKRKELLDLGFKLGMDAEEINRRIRDTYEVNVDQLSEERLDRVIEASRQKLTQKHGEASQKTEEGQANIPSTANVGADAAQPQMDIG